MNASPPTLHYHAEVRTPSGDDVASNVAQGPDRDGGLGHAYQAAVANASTGKEAFVDFTPYAPSGDQPTGFVAAPVYGENHVPTGVLAFEMPVDRINQSARLGAMPASMCWAINTAAGRSRGNPERTLPSA